MHQLQSGLNPELFALAFATKLSGEWALQSIKNTPFSKVEYGPLNICAVTYRVLYGRPHNEVNLDDFCDLDDLNDDKQSSLNIFNLALKDNRFSEAFAAALRVYGILYNPEESNTFVLTYRKNIK